jgi:hypothetical protein
VATVTAAEAETQQTTLDTPAARAIYTSCRWYARSLPAWLVAPWSQAKNRQTVFGRMLLFKIKQHGFRVVARENGSVGEAL